jgi:hypothetical protein
MTPRLKFTSSRIFFYLLLLATIGFALDIVFEPRLVIKNADMVPAGLGVLCMFWCFRGIAMVSNYSKKKEYRSKMWPICLGAGVVCSNVWIWLIADSANFPEQEMVSSVIMLAVVVPCILAARLYPEAVLQAKRNSEKSIEEKS